VGRWQLAARTESLELPPACVNCFRPKHDLRAHGSSSLTKGAMGGALTRRFAIAELHQQSGTDPKVRFKHYVDPQKLVLCALSNLAGFPDGKLSPSLNA
jgi:hypothetical protein